MVQPAKPIIKISFWEGWATVLMASLLVLTGCATEKPSAQDNTHAPDKAAMKSVVKQYSAASIAFSNTAAVLMQSPSRALFTHDLGNSVKDYADELQAIDISRCPEDFRLAFVRYYQAAGDLKTYADSITGWQGALNGLRNPYAIFSLSPNTDTAFKPIGQAAKDLELVFIKYNVGSE